MKNRRNQTIFDMKTRFITLLLPLAMCAASALAQPQGRNAVPFNGVITDAAGQGIKAKILLKHTDLYTWSDKKGRFGLSNLGQGDTLTIRHGRTSIDVPVGNPRSMRIVVLEDSARAFEAPELADSGYGYVKRREMVAGGSSGLSGDAIRRMGFTDLRTAIVSLVPGVRLIGGEFILRGQGSVNSGNGALVVCDGIPTTDVNAINVQDVESVEVQKGSNMYGLRGANGVILIRTRRK